MSCDFLALAQPGVQKLSPYVPGKPVDELARELGIDPARIIKLASNENPLGPGDKALAAIRAELAELARYPDGNGFDLKTRLAERCDVTPAQVTLGNGSNDILELVARAYLAPGLNAVFSQHAFAVYPIATQAVGASAKVVPARDYGHDLPAMLAAIDDDTRVIFIANPNNPTGTWFGREALADFLARVPERVLVVLDEAYIEYAMGGDLPDGLEFLATHPNLLVSRTFSKAYGLAALRVGYGLSSPTVADVLNRVRQPFNVNSLALAAACAALEDDAYLARSRELNAAGMAQLQDGLRALGLKWIPSRANFLAVDMGQGAGPLYQALLREGVIVRPIGGYGMPNFLRVSIGLPDENARFLEALAKVLHRAGGHALAIRDGQTGPARGGRAGVDRRLLRQGPAAEGAVPRGGRRRSGCRDAAAGGGARRGRPLRGAPRRGLPRRRRDPARGAHPGDGEAARRAVGTGPGRRGADRRGQRQEQCGAGRRTGLRPGACAFRAGPSDRRFRA
jgi:histidinol-phosphate aminotransferase